MKKTSILGIASALIRSKKYRLLLTGIQFAYLGCSYIKKRKAAKQVKHTPQKT